MIGQSASQRAGQSTLAAGTVFESTVDTFSRIRSDINKRKSQLYFLVLRKQLLYSFVKCCLPIAYKTYVHVLACVLYTMYVRRRVSPLRDTGSSQIILCVFFGANKIKGTLILSYINITCEWHICSVVTVCECKIELFFFYYYLFRRSCTTQAVFTTSH